ncbi:hypothetical protein LTR08_005753 [Meristemomyces frigidus]|nr:hypothetical protein LTR08_005753 [Meristemomyces frigidus]
MAEALAAMLSFPPDNVAKLTPKEYDQEIQHYGKALERIPTVFWTKPVDGQNVLELLNPAINSIPFAVALVEQIKATGKDKSRNVALLNWALIFFACFDPVQVRYASDQWVQLLGWVRDKLRANSIPDFTPITAAMLRLDPTAGTFTSHHLTLVRTCLGAGLPSQALPIIDKNIYAFPTSPPKNVPEELASEEHELSNGFITSKSNFTNKVHTEHILEYYLLGAHVYIGLRNFTRARLFLEYVLLTPSQQHTASVLQVEAYKKWVLIGLLAEGKAYPLPRTHDTAVMKSIRALAKPYDVLSDCFEKRDWRKFHAEMDFGAQVWHEDGTLRMVREVCDALLRFRVMDLAKTYAALEVSRIASNCEFNDAETLQMLQEMIRHGGLNASLTPGATAGEAVLRFHNTDSGPSSARVQENELEAQTKRIDDLVTFVRDADRRLQLTKEYVEYQKRSKRQGSMMDGDPADLMDLTWDAPAPTITDEGDEDIMAS